MGGYRLMDALGWLQALGSASELFTAISMLPMVYLLWASRSIETMVRMAQAAGRWPRWLPGY